MDYRPTESLKSLAKELSILITTNRIDTARKEELIKQLRQIPEETKKDDQLSNSKIDLPEETIGIWKKQSKNGKTYYSRDGEKYAEWTSWADVREIYAKGSKKRIVLLGESVARGYLYDPYYNVAKELEAILNNRKDTIGTEVIDLARTSIGMGDLRTLVKSCVILEPDMVIIFAGNNWYGDLLDSLGEEDNERVLNVYRKEAFPGVKSFIENKFAHIVSGFLKTISECLVKRRVPVIFIIPEFNLKDWKSDHIEQGLAWLPDGKMEKWLLAKDAAKLALSNNEIDKFGDSANEMTVLNPSNPLGHEFLGHYYILNKQYGKARKCFELSRDVVLFSGGNTKPRCYKVIRNQILAESPGLGIKVVDLPAIFENVFPDYIPDRDLFLDYCHLTVKGIKVAMRYTAQTVIEIITGIPVKAESIRASDLYPEQHTLAIAHFGAAIHNAHNGQLWEILQYHCNKAIALSLRIKDTMVRFSDYSTRYASSFFCKSFEEIITEREMRQYSGGFSALSHPQGRKIMDIELVDAIVNTLYIVNIDLKAKINQLRINEHGVSPEGVDLLESYYSITNYNEFIGGEPEAVFFQCRATESKFIFIAVKSAGSLTFTITCRTPNRDCAGKFINIYVNGENESVAEIPMCSKWGTYSFTIENELLEEGVNRFVIHWPYTFQPLLVETTSNYSITKTMYPVLGEIFSFIAKNA